MTAQRELGRSSKPAAAPNGRRSAARSAIRIGTRGSTLARAQAELVAARFERAGLRSEMVIVVTEGDRRTPDTAWGEGAFVGALEQALLDGRVDVAVHSAKDIPTEETEALVLAAFLPREDARDALVVREGVPHRSIADLPAGSRVGTDSPRRTGFVLAVRPDLRVHPLHGNVDTRLRRLDEGETDALVLAVAGLVRLGRRHRIAGILDVSIVPPAPGQGAIAIQARAADHDLRTRLAEIDDAETRIAVEAERAFLRAAGGGCRAPIGALAAVRPDGLTLTGGFSHPDGSAASIRTLAGPRTAGEPIARDLVATLRFDLPDLRLAAAPGWPAPARPTRRVSPDEASPAVDRGRVTDGPQRRNVRASVRTGRTSDLRVIVTRPADEVGALVHSLEVRGMRAQVVPTVAVQLAGPGGAVDRALHAATDGQWIVVTSPTGARAAVEGLRRCGVAPGSLRWAAVGPATAATLEEGGLSVDWMPGAARASAIGDGLPIEAGARVTFLRSSLADPDLPERLSRRGALVDEAVAYETIEGPSTSRAALLAALADGNPDLVVFASGSAARGLLALAEPDLVGRCRSIPAVCIGESTSASARKAGFEVIGVAAAPTAEGLAAACAEVVAAHPRSARTVGPRSSFTDVRPVDGNPRTREPTSPAPPTRRNSR